MQICFQEVTFVEWFDEKYRQPNQYEQMQDPNRRFTAGFILIKQSGPVFISIPIVAFQWRYEGGLTATTS